MTLRVLFVCLGNICRSPTAEGVFRQQLEAATLPCPVEVDSAGTADYHIGDAPDERSQKAALARGVDLSGLRGRQVSAEDFARFDYIIAMDRANLRELKALAPRGSRAKLKLFLDFAPQLGRSEVPDPYYGGRGGFEDVLDLCAAASQGLLTELQKVPQ